MHEVRELRPGTVHRLPQLREGGQGPAGGGHVGGWLLAVRRAAIFVILLLAYVYYRSAGDAQLATIGLLSFAAIAQLAPAFFHSAQL